MIQTLLIQNFQSHKRTELNFDRGVNVIIGPSDSGKSAILRALRWLFWNRPQGDGMKSNWCKKGDITVAKIWANSGDHASREIGVDGKHFYTQHAQLFKAIRTEVPQEVQDFLNVSDINLQRQLDQPFLISNTPGEVALHFNKVAKLDKIDTATQRINGWIRELTNVIKYNESQKDTLSTQLESFEYLEKAEIELEALEEMDKRYVQACQNKTKLFSLISNITSVETEINRESTLLPLEVPVDELLTLWDRWYEKFKQSGALMADMDDVTDVSAKIEEQEALTMMESQVNELLSLYDALQEKEDVHEKLSKAKMFLTNLNTKIEGASNRYETLHKRYEEEYPDVCPFCNSKVK